MNNTITTATHKTLYETLTSKNAEYQYILANGLSGGFNAETQEDEGYALLEALKDEPTDEEIEEIKKECEKTGEDFDYKLQEYIEDSSQSTEVYQTFIVDERTHEMLKDYGEITYYLESIDSYFWAITHFGTAWSHVMTNLPINNQFLYEKN